MRVLLLIKGLGVGGAERLMVDVVSARDSERFAYEVAYVLADQHALARDLRAAGVPVHSLGARASWDLRWLRTLRRLLAEGDFDVVHSHLPYSAAFGRLVATSLRGERRPMLVYTEHSLWTKAAVLTKALNALTVGLDDALLVVSPTAREALPRRLRDRASVVVHGVDRSRAKALVERRHDVRAEVRAELAMDDGEVLALTVANVRQEKGYDVLLEAARIAVREGTSVRFVCVGSGPALEALTNERDSSGLGGHLEFLGLRGDTLRLMAAADMFVLPSHQEGMPVALMEAMTLGLPVVATTVGGVPDVVTHGVEGLMVPPGRPELLARAVSRLAADAQLRQRLSEAARNKSADFDVTVATRSIEAIYDELLSRASPRASPRAPSAKQRVVSEVPLVLHVIPITRARGAQREARALADRLDVPGTRHHRLLNLFAGPGDVVAEYSLDHPGGRTPAVGLDLRLVVRLHAELARLDPSVVVAHGGDSLKYVVPAMIGRRRPLAYYAIGTFAGSSRRGARAWWSALMSRADVVACEGKEVLTECSDLLRVPPSRLVLAPNGRDPGEFRPLQDDEGDEGREAAARRARSPRVTFVGALNEGKGPDRFVEVVAELRRRGLELDAVVCGDGPMRGELEQPSAEAGVELLGSRQDVAALLRGTDVLIFPSRPTGEGMPGVLIEAGLSGVPVVATDVPGVAWIVEDSSTGFVVPVDDLAALEDAAARLLGDRTLREHMGAAARSRCETNFTLETVAACWLSFLEPLLRQGHCEPEARRSGGLRPAGGHTVRRR